MREILFMGKRKDNGEWVYGGIEQLKHVTFIYDKELPYCNQVPVIPETIGQYTGLRDKDGAKIYEGDIVHCISRFDDAKMVVIFEDGEFRMVLLEKIDSYVSGGGFYALRCFEKEVIGNIHDSLN